MRASIRLVVLLFVITIAAQCVHANPPVVPVWTRGYPLYEIYVRSASPEGTFAGLSSRLGTIKELGIRNLWLMPIYPLGVEGRKGTYGSPYAVRDILQPNPEFGDSTAFQELLNNAHQLGMKLILDWVPNHSANDHILMKSHPEWWMHDKDGKFTREVKDWSDITDYNYDNQGAREYLNNGLKHWLKGYGVDGFRFDVAMLVPDDYWKSTLKPLSAEQPDALFLAEAYGDNFPQVGFHSMYDWPLYHAMVAHVQGKLKLDTLKQQLATSKWNNDPFFYIMRFIENHDEQRAVKVFGAAKVPAYTALIFSIPGIPLIYSGQEIGASEKPSLFEKEPINWEQVNIPLHVQYKRWVHWRNQLPSLREGRVEYLDAGNASDRVLLVQRQYENETTVVAINLSSNPSEITLPQTLSNGVKTTDMSEAVGENLVGMSWNGTVKLTLQPWSARMLVVRK